MSFKGNLLENPLRNEETAAAFVQGVGTGVATTYAAPEVWKFGKAVFGWIGDKFSSDEKKPAKGNGKKDKDS